jgi:antitoxin component YwqK of YwqJK toxin-antitoxin module
MEDITTIDLCDIALAKSNSKGFVQIYDLHPPLCHEEHIIYFMDVKFKKKTKINIELENECDEEIILAENKINIYYTTINGLLENDYLIYDRKGKLTSKLHYKSGKLDGESIHYNIFVRNSDEIVKLKKYVCTYSNGIELSCKECD